MSLRHTKGQFYFMLILMLFCMIAIAKIKFVCYNFENKDEVIIMMHSKRCPHCKNIIGGGHGYPIKRLGSPLKQCSLCGNTYVDLDMIEWEISPAYRKLGYCFANNRIWICLVPSFLLGAMVQSGLLFMVCFAIAFAFCYAYVKSQVDAEIGASRRRVKDEGYVDLLIAAGYPVKRRVDF